MDYKSIRELLDELKEDLYYHEYAKTSDKQVEALENLEKGVDELYGYFFETDSEDERGVIRKIIDKLQDLIK